MRFKRVYIEITNTCNLHCSFCIQNSRPPRRLSVAEFSYIAEQIQPYTEHVYLHVLGEPLSHPRLKDILDICEQRGLRVHLTTNATLLKQRLEILCHPALQQLNISLHSFSEHEQPAYLEDIFFSADRLAACHIHVNFRFWGLREHQLSTAHEQLLQKVLRTYHYTDELPLRRLLRVDLRPYIHLHFEAVFTWPSLTHAFVSAQGRCLGMKTMCAIFSDGSVVPCCLDTKGDCMLGNLFEVPLADIISSKRAQAMLDGFAKRQLVEPLCQHCSYHLRFL